MGSCAGCPHDQAIPAAPAAQSAPWRRALDAFTSEIERIAPKGLLDGDFPEAQDAEPYPISAVGYSLDDIRGQTLGLEEKIA